MLVDVIAAVAVLGAVVVEGEGTCPSPAAVEERLRPLLPAQGDGPPDVARLSRADDGLRIDLRRADGTAAGSRTVPGTHGCDELADAVAVMLAAWQTDGRDRLPVAPAPSPAPASSGAAPIVAAPMAAPPKQWRWEVGAGAGGALAGDELVPAGLVTVDLSRGGLLGLSARAHLGANREAPLPDGTASWRRWLLSAGPRARLVGRRWFGEAFAGGGATWLAVSGRGFPSSQRHDDLVAGFEGALRVGWNRSGLRPFLDLAAAFWPVRSIVYQAPDQRSAALPRVELLVTAGAAFSR